MMQTPLPPAEDAPHAERTRGADGLEYWKLTCFCGKTLLAPIDGQHKQGKCPQCGKRLLFPLREKHITTGPLPIIPARREEPKRIVERVPAREPRDRAAHASKRLRPESSTRIKLGQTAAEGAAERLRPKHDKPATGSGTGLVSAWPPADHLRRILAAFIDLTVVALGVAALIAIVPVIPSPMFLTVFALVFHEANDGLLQLVIKGSLGRKLALITLLDSDGQPPSSAKVLARPLLKILCLHGCILIFFDDQRRAMHDFLLGTRMLKGRA